MSNPFHALVTRVQHDVANLDPHNDDAIEELAAIARVITYVLDS